MNRILFFLGLLTLFALAALGANVLKDNGGTSAYATVTGSDIANDAALAGNPTTTSQAATDNSTKIATTAWVMTAGGWVISTVTGSDATTTGQSLVDITGLTFATVANSTYEIELILSITTSADTTGIKYGFAHSGAGASAIFLFTGPNAATTLTGGCLSALATASTQTFAVTSAQAGVVVVHGFVTTGANAGNLTAQHLKVTSGTSTVKIGSVMKVRKVA